MVGYVHDSTTVWKIWDPEEGKVKSQSEVIFDEERNAYASCPPAYETEEEEEDIFGLKAREPRQLEYIEESPEAHTPEERNTLEDEESPEANTPEEQTKLEARASCRKERQKQRMKLRPEEGVEAKRITRSMARGNASATMMMTNALTGLEEDPLTYRDAMERPEKENWQQAIQEEYEAIMRNKTFEETKEPQAQTRKLLALNGYLNESTNRMAASDTRQDLLYEVSNKPNTEKHMPRSAN